MVNPFKVCALLLEECGTAANLFDSNWTIPLPAGPDPHRIDVENRTPKLFDKTMSVLQISDLHFDWGYTPGAEVDCAFPICCQMNSSGWMSNSTTTIKQKAGYWGSIGKCDLPAWTVRNMLKHIKETHKVHQAFSFFFEFFVI